MFANKILVAYDGSTPSHKALDVARDVMAANPSVEVILVHVMRLMSSGAAASGIDTLIMDDVLPIKNELQQIADSFPNKTEVRILKGSSPADLIVECAKEEGCDLIIMGSRGKGGVKGYLGSVSYAVTKESPMTVLIAKEGAID